MDKAKWVRNLEVYCPGATCGDPEPSLDGQTLYTKRRMVYAGGGKTRVGTWIEEYVAEYRCPVCGHSRMFRTHGNRLEEW